MGRRRFLITSVTVTTVVLAGCSDPDEEDGDGGGIGYDLDEAQQFRSRDNSRIAR